ncbi:MAG: YggS family pyridoxal phosphate-dependent enzyme [Clostridia bacterium]|nr:YggS family pyridoxal phosphate-dependent enzyme [Clostridia bacterium]
MDEYILKRIKDFDENYKVVTEKLSEAAVKSGRAPSDITLLAATKTVEVPVINHAYESGIKVMGENRVQEFLSKENELAQGLRRQFIGTLQTNKVRQIVGKVELIQSVDSIKLANEIAKQSIARNIVTNVLVEINIGKEESKSGINEENLDEFLCQLSTIEGIFVKGLMTLGPVNDELTQKIAYFDKMQKLFIDNKAKKVDNISMDILSMGMSHDFDIAILHGANMVRVGTSLFGSRIY